MELVSGAYDDSYKRALDLVEEQGRTLIHPFDDPDVIAGQGTIGLEILDQPGMWTWCWCPSAAAG